MAILVIVEFVNLVVLLTNNTVIDVIMNFLALVIITEFDDLFFKSSENEKLSKLLNDGQVEIDGKVVILEEITQIETTTSHLARYKNQGNKLLKKFARKEERKEEQKIPQSQ